MTDETIVEKTNNLQLDDACEFSIRACSILNDADKASFMLCFPKCTTTQKAAFRGHLTCLQRLHTSGISWDEDTCACAASNGHEHCLRYAHENGCPWDRTTCSQAAFHGHLSCLKYAYEHGCPWNFMTCRNAAENNHIACLKYAYRRGCPWNKNDT